MSIKVLIVDDHGVLRAGLRALLNAENDIQVIGEAANTEETIALVLDKNPDVILMDISLGGESGVEITKILTDRNPSLRILMLTIHEDETLLKAALQNGAAGYILKRAVESELINAIHSVADGHMYIHPAMTRGLLGTIIEDEDTDETITLTTREIDVLKLIVQGNTNRQIANLLSLSVRTVESHRSNIMSKLNLRSRVELVRYAAAHGLIDIQN